MSNNMPVIWLIQNYGQQTDSHAQNLEMLSHLKMFLASSLT